MSTPRGDASFVDAFEREVTFVFGVTDRLRLIEQQCVNGLERARKTGDGEFEALIKERLRQSKLISGFMFGVMIADDTEKTVAAEMADFLDYHARRQLQRYAEASQLKIDEMMAGNHTLANTYRLEEDTALQLNEDIGFMRRGAHDEDTIIIFDDMK